MKYAHQIHQYLDARHQHESDSLTKETNIRSAFHKLIQDIAGKDFKTIQEQTAKTSSNKTIYYDLALTRDGMPWGLVEDKDARDNLDTEVLLKNRSQYDFSNMIFENGHEMLLFQDGQEVGRCVFFTGMLVKRYQNMSADLQAFDKLLQKFINYIPKGARGYAESLEKFQESVPVLAADILREIDYVFSTDQKFRARFAEYMQSLRLAISEALSEDDVKQMLVQHILTADLFKEILGSDDYVRFNTIARTLDDLAMSLGREFSHRVATDIRPYYHNLANNIHSMGSGNQFSIEVLRQFYETFYQAYDTKRADTYGIVYTPVQVVDFMVTMADSLLKEHFGKNIYSKNVHVLDPCVGTGSFMVSILEYIAQYARGELIHKFENELHANELSILAYYIGNIHIELTFSRLSGGLFSEFNNMCYVDTLDNVYAIEKKAQQQAFSFAITEENARRVQAQNEKPLMLIIGNPPYNRQQQNENQNNKNKRYQFVDQRIKDTYSEMGISQNKHQLYDMYLRFIRWATDRLGNEGIIAFITNRSFLDSYALSGFRRTVYPNEFSHIYCVDLGGDVRKGGMGGNVFDIQTGVAISFLIKAPNSRIPESIRYINPFDPLATKEDKLAWLSEHTQYNDQKHLSWQNIEPNSKGYWINQSTSDFESLFPLGDKQNRGKPSAESIFYLFSLGINTSRDDWSYDYSSKNLTIKIQYFISIYQKELKRWQSIPDEEKGETDAEKERFRDNFVDTRIKWAADLKNQLTRGKIQKFQNSKIISSLYRPFRLRSFYYEPIYIERTYQMPSIFPTGARGENLMIIALSVTERVEFSSLISNTLINLNFFRDPAQCFPLYRYGEDGHKTSNITPDYRQKFTDALQADVTDEQIFYYIYAMLHHRQYRQDYKIDLTQNLPAVPISQDFFALSSLGRELGDLHVNFDTTEPYEITRMDKEIENPLPKLRSKSENRQIIIDEATILSDIPVQAWEYKLGNRTAIDWVLEGYKVKKISADNGDIANPYSPLYTEYGYQAYAFTPEVKEECIMLLRRIITLSLKTQELIEQISSLRMKE